jgi:hypothetical protein
VAALANRPAAKLTAGLTYSDATRSVPAAAAATDRAISIRSASNRRLDTHLQPSINFRVTSDKCVALIDEALKLRAQGLLLRIQISRSLVIPITLSLPPRNTPIGVMIRYGRIHVSQPVCYRFSLLINSGYSLRVCGFFCFQRGAPILRKHAWLKHGQQDCYREKQNASDNRQPDHVQHDLISPNCSESRR